MYSAYINKKNYFQEYSPNGKYAEQDRWKNAIFIAMNYSEFEIAFSVRSANNKRLLAQQEMRLQQIYLPPFTQPMYTINSNGRQREKYTKKTVMWSDGVR